MSRFAIPSIKQMSVERRDARGRIVLAVAGEVDLNTSPDLRSATVSALESGAPELCVDLSDTTFMDSSGLHVLLDAHQQAQELDIRLTIVCPPGNVRRVFDLTGLAKSLPVHDGSVAADLVA